VLHNQESRHARFAFMPLSPKQREFLHNYQNFHLQTTRRQVRLAQQQRTNQRLLELHYQQLLREQALTLQEEDNRRTLRRLQRDSCLRIVFALALPVTAILWCVHILS
jgi:hypothetical protein